MPIVKLIGWQPGLRKVSLVTLLQQQADLSFTSAKQNVDYLLAGKHVNLEVGDRRKANQLAEEVRKLGCVCVIEQVDSAE